MESGGVSPLKLALCYFEQHASFKIGKLAATHKLC